MCTQLLAFGEKPQEIILDITVYAGTSRDAVERFIHVLIKRIHGVLDYINELREIFIVMVDSVWFQRF